MTSQKSTNHKSICLLSLMREDLRHKTWMLALSVLGSALAGPIAFLFYFSGHASYSLDNVIINGDKVYNLSHHYLMTLREYHLKRLSHCLDYLGSYDVTMMTIIAYLGAMIVALAGFRYLYHKRMVDLYHSAPVSRKKLFVSTWLVGFLIWFVPAFFASLLVFIEASVYMGGLFLGTIFVTSLRILLRMTLIFLIVYNACLVAVMLSGNVLNAMVGCLSYGFLVVAFKLTVILTENMFFSHFFLPQREVYLNPLYVLSPLMTPFILAYHWINETPLGSFSIHLFGGMAIMLLNLILAYVLYLKRPSELSERGLEAKGVCTFFRFAISMISGICCTLLLALTTERQIGWMIFGAFFGTALTFCVLNVIYHGSFKEVFSHKLQYAAVFVTTILFVFAVMFDWTGYDNYLPKKTNLKGLSIYVSSFSDPDSYYKMVDGKLQRSSQLYERSREDYVCRDPEVIHDLLDACVHSDEEIYDGLYYVTVKVMTNWGYYYREYTLSRELASALAPIVESKEYQDCYYPIKSMQFDLPDQIGIIGSFTADEYVMDKEKIQAIVNAMHQDFMEHNSMAELLRDSRIFTLEFYYEDENGFLNEFRHDVPYWYTHVIELINKWYPNKQWDPEIDEITSFTFCDSIVVGKEESLREAIYKHYGYALDGTPLSSPAKAPTNYEMSTLPWANWNETTREVSFLKALEPYLIWGHYQDALSLEYAQLGWAELSSGGSVNCYVRYGTLPLELLDGLPLIADIDAPYSYEYSDPIIDYAD